MTLIRKLGWALCLVFLFTTLSSNSQTTLDYTTGNIVLPTVQGSGTTPWTGGVYQDSLTCWAGGNPGYCGPNAIVRPGNNINFSYGSTYLYQQQNVANLVPANALNITGYNFSFTAKNGNGWDDGRVDQLTALVRFWDASGGRGANNLLYGNSYDLNYKFNWTTFDYNQTLPNPLPVKSVGQVQYGFIGRDNNFWAGPYGPEINNVSFHLKYSVDPCATNPAFSPNCAGFKDVLTSNNLVPNPGGYAVFGNSINQSFAINTALASAGSAAQIHGFNWGYVANANGPYCGSWDMGFLGCWDQRNPSVSTHVSITNSAGANLYSVDRNYQNSYNTTNYSYLFPSSQTMSNLGNFNFTASTNDQAYIGSMWSRALYTADPCVVNPLSSPTCPGYAVAFAKTITSSSTTSTTSTTTAYTGITSPTTSSQVETSPTGVVDQTQPTTSQTTTTASSTTVQDTTQSTTVAQDNPAQPSPTQAGPAPTSPQPVGGPPQTTTASATASSSSSPSSNSSAGPSKLAMSVVKTAQANDKATQAAAVSSAAKTLENATQSSQASSNLAISMNQDMSANSAVAAANFASQSTQASQQTAVQAYSGPQQTMQSSSQVQQSVRGLQQMQQQDVQTTQIQSNGNVVQIQQFIYTPPAQQQDSQSTEVAMLKPPASVVMETPQQASSGTGITISRNMFAYNPLTSSNTSMSLTLTPPAPTYQPRLDPRQYEVEAPQTQIASFGGLGRPGNPLSELMMQQRFESLQSNITPSMSSVNRNVQSNELAGGVDIASMATVPAGFNAYSFVLRDAAFYEPKEVYKNQRTVDNERVLRGLTRGSDSLHQQMVDQQYKSGN